MSNFIDDYALPVFVIGIFALFIGWSVYYEWKHPCIRTERVVTHHPAEEAGSDVGISFGGGAAGTLDYSGGINIGSGLTVKSHGASEAYDTFEDVCVERK